MNNTVEQDDRKRLVGAAIEATIRIAAIGALAYWCIQILAPFVMLLVWGLIIAVAVYPTFQKVVVVFKGRKALAATVISLGLLIVLLAPTLILVGTLVEGIEGIARTLQEGTLRIPPPPEWVSTLPIIGRQLASFWTMASQNLGAAVAKAGPAAMDIAKWLLAGAASLGAAILLFVAAVIVAGVLLGYSEKAAGFAKRFATRLAGARGGEFVTAAESTIRSVAVGILGIAFIQAVLAGLGMLVAGIPGAGLWAFVCLLLSITQIGGLPVLLPAAIYMFATADTLPAVLFAAWAAFVGVVDNILKPILLGRGTETPMLIVLIGSIGGLIVSGVVGLFVGAVVFTLGYKLLLVWLEEHA